MFIRQTWVESRLQLPNDIFEEGDDYVTLPSEFFDNLWHPDPYFLNSKITGRKLSSNWNNLVIITMTSPWAVRISVTR